MLMNGGLLVQPQEPRRRKVIAAEIGQVAHALDNAGDG
jgi:hypothetical protein